ncbi:MULTISPECIES: hypothetical protein [unclassified Leeuwenhoekiella]|uniref:hypothetical protein n=1 Tax=unclassified Leeuwenhoekiella TaxID=2615029 RepID=UPI000C49AC43|nr:MULTISPECIES: hypothetical protein [unclassified Leeuwenhoekiella]MAS71541.1 hypothetical protein [Zunongwangia sp.]MAW96280.1 hypothetical protein [Leeuwenhoekiella sp.]MBA82771.1 hypothetical protein [Leeuwenhoekiella sp.]|tara:strand:- start:466 stop:1086 length:621 start_codon:yes stop_codon:yes gene_type:complete
MAKYLNTARRINTILALAVVFLLVLATNRIDQHHFKTVQNNMNEVFEDRVLVQDYIFSISNILRDQQLDLLNGTGAISETFKDEQISEIITKFESTKLTPAEQNLLKKFKQDYNKLVAMQDDPIKNADLQFKERTNNRLNALQQNLLELSEIQVQESRRLTREAQKSLDVNDLLANLEIFFLIVIGIALQVLIFYKSKKLAKKDAA